MVSGSDSGGTGSGQSVSAGLNIDPMRLALTYWPWLAASVVVGSLLGFGLNWVLARTSPRFASTTQFQVQPAFEGDNVNIATGRGGADEIERYMKTEVQVITSARILRDAVEEPSIERDTVWARDYMVNGVFDPTEAVRDLANHVAAAVIPDTTIIVLRVEMENPNDAQIIGRAISDTYLADNLRQTTFDADTRIREREDARQQLRRDAEALERQMDSILEDGQVIGATETVSVSFQEIQKVTPQITDMRQQIVAIEGQIERYEEAAANSSGSAPVYPEEIRLAAENDQIVREFESDIERATAFLQASKENAGPNQRSVIRQERQLEALRERREALMEEKRRDLFAARVESLRQNLAEANAQLEKLMDQRAEATQRQTELTGLLTQRENLARQRERLLERAENHDNIISSLELLKENGQRVRVLAPASFPDGRSFPRLRIMGPLGVLLVSGLTCGIVLLKELREQRVRFPRDITSIPRTRVLGVTPDLELDSTRPERAELASLTSGTGALAESVRQMRNTLSKVFAARGYKSLLVVSGLPGSGASTVTSNLASSASVIGRRVLAIDANLRRPALASIFGTPEGEGLAEVLRGRRSLEEAVSPAPNAPGLDVLGAGLDREHGYEFFATEAFERLMAEASSRYDLVVIDSPPAVVSGDALAMSAYVDAAALVVRAYGEKRGLVARLRNQLTESPAEFMGVIVNAVRPSAGGYFKRNFKATTEYASGSSAAERSAGAEREPAGSAAS